MREMVRALNQMLRERAEGGEPDFDSFMQTVRRLLPRRELAGRPDRADAAPADRAMQAMMDSMSRGAARAAHDMIDQLIGDDRLRVDLAELAMNLEHWSRRRLRHAIQAHGR